MLFSRHDPFQPLISHSPGLESLIRSAQIAAAADITILIQGETGVGKELLAQSIHRASPRADKPMITVNCAALNDQLIESQLFGHVKGAFTDAHADSVGYIEAADNGCLFLDEIGELSARGQAALLRFLESGECQKAGSNETRYVDARVIAATHRDLQQMVSAGEFRQDLFYRLNVVTLRLPALRERRRDIALLFTHFCQRYANSQNKQPPQADKSALKRLQQHDWPGNVRELRNLCARLVTLHDSGATISAQTISDELARHASTLDSSLFELPPEGIRLEQLEQDLLQQALDRADGNKSRAARLLGITRDAFLYRLKKHKL